MSLEDRDAAVARLVAALKSAKFQPRSSSMTAGSPSDRDAYLLANLRRREDLAREFGPMISEIFLDPRDQRILRLHETPERWHRAGRLTADPRDALHRDAIAVGLRTVHGLSVREISFLPRSDEFFFVADEFAVACRREECFWQALRGARWHDEGHHCPTWTDAAGCRCDLGGDP